MKRIVAALACALTALALSSSASAIQYGVTEDEGKLNPNGVYTQLEDIGMNMNVMSITWDPANPTALPPDMPLIQTAVTVAATKGIDIILAVYQGKARGITDTPNANVVFGQWLRNVVTACPRCDKIIVLNEPNVNRFWQPQWDPASCTSLSPAPYTATLAAGYDAIKAADPTVRVYGVGLSPRGNDLCNAATNPSHSPVRFLNGMGKAYRAMGRNLPLMDALSFHPYPNINTDLPSKGYQWPNVGVPNLDRLKQAFWDAFNGTAQPTFGEGVFSYGDAASPGFKMALDEVGWQTATTGMPEYTGNENVPTIDEQTQGNYYAELVRFLACDPSVESLNFFHLVDEADRDRFQTGLVRAGGAIKKASYDAVKSAIAQTGGNCQGGMRVWRHSTTVAAANADFGNLRTPAPRKRTFWSARMYAEEDYAFELGVFKVTRTPNAADRASIGRALAVSRAAKAPRPILRAGGAGKAYFNIVVKAPAKRLAAGKYVYGIRVRAAMNPSRTNVFISAPFTVK